MAEASETPERPGMYLALDANFTSSPAIEELGETHGPAGPCVFIALLTMSKQQGAGGAVQTTCRKLAEASFASKEEIPAIVNHAAALGSLRVLEVGDRSIHILLSHWSDWQGRAAAADKKARQRAERAARNGTTPEGVPA